jgi:Lamin Tail Domain
MRRLLTVIARISPRRCATAVVATAALAGAAAVAPSVVQGAPTDDLDAVLKDFDKDSKITPCFFTKAELTHAKGEIPADFNAYGPELKVELNNEIHRWIKGGCSGGKSKGVRVTKAKGKGSARKESVTIKNASARRVNLGGYSLRNVEGKKLRLSGVTLAKGKTLRVLTGCASGKTSASLSGGRYYACKKTQQWSDKGDVVELLSKTGKVLARRPTT